MSSEDDGPLRPSLGIAQKVASERDPKRLLELAEQLTRALEKELATKVLRKSA